MITKEQWEEIEKELTGYFGNVKFKIEDTEISINKEFIKENKLGYLVYLNGIISDAYSNPKHKDFRPISQKVWHKKTMSYYKPREKAKLIKDWGIRKAKKMVPDLDKKIIYYVPYFEKFSVLKRQFSKIKELELVKIG